MEKVGSTGTTGGRWLDFRWHMIVRYQGMKITWSFDDPVAAVVPKIFSCANIRSILRQTPR